MTSDNESMTAPSLPETKAAQDLLAMKYLSGGETTLRESSNRQAGALTDNPDDFHELNDSLQRQEVLLGGRMQSAVGSSRKVTAVSCFVSGNIEDSIMGPEGIMARLTESIETMRRGGGDGYNFSTLRPRHDRIKSLDSSASGPVSFMKLFDAGCDTIASAGHRRGAQMGVMMIWHPDIEEYVLCKNDQTSLKTFNISIGVTDEFMRAVVRDTDFELKFNGVVYRTVKARALWDKVMRSTWDWSEPGILFMDRINENNNLWYRETIFATNPCGEQPLPADGSCVLGSINLPKFVYETDAGFRFDMEGFKKAVRLGVRALDAVIDETDYPLESQRIESQATRRIGLGVTGVANAIEVVTQSAYGSKAFCDMLDELMQIQQMEAYKASIELAKEHGSFPEFDVEKFCDGAHIKTLPWSIQTDIRKHGIRNSHVLSVAPTGTISQVADNCSAGCEPVFASKTTRDIQTENGPITLNLIDYALRKWNYHCTPASEVSVDSHLKVQAIIQKYVCAAVSKTVNCGKSVLWDDFKNIYMKAWKMGLKGVTTFRIHGKRAALLRESMEEGGSCTLDPETGQRDCGN